MKDDYKSICDTRIKDTHITRSACDVWCTVKASACRFKARYSAYEHITAAFYGEKISHGA